MAPTAEVDIVGKYVERMMQGYRIDAFSKSVNGMQPATDPQLVDTTKVGEYGSVH